jgi:hypothetical protein
VTETITTIPEPGGLKAGKNLMILGKKEVRDIRKGTVMTGLFEDHTHVSLDLLLPLGIKVKLVPLRLPRLRTDISGARWAQVVHIEPMTGVELLNHARAPIGDMVTRLEKVTAAGRQKCFLLNDRQVGVHGVSHAIPLSNRRHLQGDLPPIRVAEARRSHGMGRKCTTDSEETRVHHKELPGSVCLAKTGVQATHPANTLPGCVTLLGGWENCIITIHK